MAAKTDAPDLSGFDKLDEIANDPDKLAAFKAETLAKAKRDNPNLTDAQLEEHWKIAEQTFFG